MTVKGVIFDVSGTMMRQNQAVPGIVEAVQRLHQLGVQIVAVHNDGPQAQVAAYLHQSGIHVDEVVTSREVGRKKGSPLWIDYIKNKTGLRTNELLYVGDSDMDMITASHSKVVYIHASWSVPNNKYGFSAPQPGWVAAVVEHIFRKTHPWGWSFEYLSPSGHHTYQFALANVNVLKSAGIQYDLVEMLKDRQDPKIGQMTLREFVILHLTASIYATGLQDTTDFWSVMPSHDGQRVSRMTDLLDLVAKIFRDHYEGDLLQRHTLAEHSRDARQKGIDHAIANQANTLLVNPLLTEKINGKRALIIDDFLAMGISVGSGRMLLRMGGAANAVVVAIGKYGPRTTLIGLPSPMHWDATKPKPAGLDTRIPNQEANGTFHQGALDEFVASYHAMLRERW
jgi:hypothetical protein